MEINYTVKMITGNEHVFSKDEENFYNDTEIIKAGISEDVTVERTPRVWYANYKKYQPKTH